MNIQIIGDNVPVTDKIKAIIEEKISTRLDRILSDFSPDILIATMRLEQLARTQEYKVNFDMMLPGKERIYASHTHKNLTSAITGLREQVEKQVRKYHEELNNH